MDKDLLIKFISEDADDLLYVKPALQHQNPNDRLILKFQEINEFIRENYREPSSNSADIHEFSLGVRLSSFKQNDIHIQKLREHDVFEILESQKAPTCIEDILTEDCDLLSTPSNNIFNLIHVRKPSAVAEYIAQRKVCQNFFKFENIFIQCQADLATGKRKLVPFANEQQIEKGDFFILKGVMTYVVEVGEKESKNGKTNARLHCVFENGTESDILLRSLARELYRDGKRVTIHENNLIDGLNGIEQEDRETGYIYVLKSLTKRPDIQRIEHLYKIGFSRTPVEERTKNAEQDPTFLMAPVTIITSYQCYNLNPQKFEHLLHRFFGHSCLDIEIFDHNNRVHSPREWFIAPLEIIDEAVQLLKNGSITHYRYDHLKKQIVFRDDTNDMS